MVDIRTKKMKKIAPILKNAYSSKIQLSDVKKLHLMQLCKKKMSSQRYILKTSTNKFYKSPSGQQCNSNKNNLKSSYKNNLPTYVDYNNLHGS